MKKLIAGLLLVMGITTSMAAENTIGHMKCVGVARDVSLEAFSYENNSDDYEEYLTGKLGVKYIDAVRNSLYKRMENWCEVESKKSGNSRVNLDKIDNDYGVICNMECHNKLSIIKDANKHDQVNPAKDICLFICEKYAGRLDFLKEGVNLGREEAEKDNKNSDCQSNVSSVARGDDVTKKIDELKNVIEKRPLATDRTK